MTPVSLKIGSTPSVMKLVATLVMSLAMAGCSLNPPTRNAQPVPELPQNWQSAQSESAIDGWASQLADPQLTILVKEAVQANPSLAASRATLRRFAALARISSADGKPQLSLSAGSQRGRSNELTSTGHNLQLNVSWELDLFQRIANQNSASQQDYLASEADLQSAQLTIAASVARSWFNLQQAVAQKRLALQRRDSRNISLELVQARYNRGLGNIGDVHLAKSTLASADAEVASRQQALDAAVLSLESLLGRYPAGQIKAAGALPNLPDVLPAGIPSELMTRRPDLLAAQARLAAADSRLAAAHAARFPSISLTAAAGGRSNEFSDIFSSQGLLWNLAGNLTAPIINGGRLKANQQANQAAAEIAEASYNNSLLSALTEVETALSAEQHLRTQQAAYQVALEQSRAAETRTKEQYGRGLTDYLNLLEAQRSADQAEQQLVVVTTQLLINRIDLYSALGARALP
ncbi:efflux transporter outer membrane subunit [Pelagibaculum spongiae]|uniref:Transporter n=1 Tax=Pelagibaculum spongiae TaxID=2080658 RepID=A0A2V1GYG4_9GAMM|nr:efflux transporter outer membrane subunit [Pelagibaculum spongiae]PVZ67714.1 hypothetical protein DC094_14870 [Pelagibaculum spongiae]